MTDRGDPVLSPDTPDPAIDAVLEDLFEQPEAEWEAALEKACARFPDQEDSIRRRFSMLREMGFLEEAEPPASGRIGDFRLLRLLGEGGMGVVYLAEQESLGRRVALKLIRKEFLLVPRARERFQREALAVSRLDHPGICPVYEVGEADGTPYIAMRYVEGETLARRIAGSRLASSREAVFSTVRLLEEAARAVHAAHEQGLIHRDVKPGNIMVTGEGVPVILDFGLARDELLEGRTLTRTGDPLGTPAYMSPEQVSGDRTQLDRRTDVYSLGATLYESLTLETPFRSPTREGLYRAILTREPADPRRLNPALPRDLKVVLETALEKDPDRRYATALAFAEDLKAVQEGKPVAAKPISAVGRGLRWARREPARAGLLLVLLVGIPALAGLGGFLLANLESMRRGAALAREERIERHLEAGFAKIMDIPSMALAPFERALQEKSDCAEAVAGLAISLAYGTDKQAALEYLDRHAALSETIPSLKRIRAMVLRDLGREQEALTLEDAVGPPHQPLEFYLLGVTKYVRGHREINSQGRLAGQETFSRAMALFEKAIHYSDRARALYFYAWAAAAGYARNEAVVREAADILRRRWPGLPSTWVHVGQALMGVDPGAAIEALEEAIAANPGEKHLLYGLGLACEAKCDWEGARRAFERCNELQSDHGPTLTNLGLMTQACGDNVKALEFFERAMEVAPDYAQAYLGAGVIHSANGDAGRAIAAYTRCLELNPFDVRATLNLGHLHVEGGRLDQAVACYRSVTRHCSGPWPVSSAHIGLGLVLEERDQLGKAEASLRKAVEVHPEFLNAHYNLAAVVQCRGRFHDALDHYENGLDCIDKLPPEAMQDPSEMENKFRFYIAQCEVLAPLETRLEAALHGKGAETVQEVLAAVDRTCGRKKLFAGAACLYRRALEERPALAGNPVRELRFRAAVFGALTGFHRGADRAVPSHAANRRWRGQARIWLLADLAAWKARLEAGKVDGDAVRRALGRWQSHRVLARFRQEAFMSALPEEEQEKWQSVWSGVEALLARVRK